MPCFDGVGNYSQSSTPRPRPSSLVLIVEIIGYPEQGDQIWRNFKGLWQFEKGIFSILRNLWTYSNAIVSKDWSNLLLVMMKPK